MLPRNLGQRTVVIALSIDGGCGTPSQAEASRLENLIRYDLAFDGYTVTLTVLEPTKAPDTYAWRARIRSR